MFQRGSPTNTGGGREIRRKPMLTSNLSRDIFGRGDGPGVWSGRNSIGGGQLEKELSSEVEKRERGTTREGPQDQKV